MRNCGCMAAIVRKVIGGIFCALGLLLAAAVSMMIWICAALPDYECAQVFGRIGLALGQ